MVQTVHQVVKRDTEDPMEGGNWQHCWDKFHHLVRQCVDVVLEIVVSVISQILVVQQAAGCLYLFCWHRLLALITFNVVIEDCRPNVKRTDFVAKFPNRKEIILECFARISEHVPEDECQALHLDDCLPWGYTSSYWYGWSRSSGEPTQTNSSKSNSCYWSTPQQSNPESHHRKRMSLWPTGPRSEVSPEILQSTE